MKSIAKGETISQPAPLKEYSIGEIVELLEEADRRGLLETFTEDELERMTIEQLRIIVEVKQ